jgi:hypothetical protein
LQSQQILPRVLRECAPAAPEQALTPSTPFITSSNSGGAAVRKAWCNSSFRRSPRSELHLHG